jgi:RNA polymerase sigma-70 factor (ECF subfamily)
MSRSDPSAAGPAREDTSGAGRAERDSAGEIGRPDAVDRALVSRAIDGDQRAFESLLKRHESRVLRVLRLLGVHPDDRDDVAQEVFVRVFRYLPSYRPGRPFAGWVYRISVNAVHDHRARTRRRLRDEAPWPQGLEETSRPGETRQTPENHAILLRRRLEAALDVLSERERAVFVLREMEGLSSADVARSLGITQITVRRHLSRARRALQRKLGLDR